MIFPVLLGVSACTMPPVAVAPPVVDSVETETDDGVMRPVERPASLDTTPPPPPPSNARTVEDFDTTSAEDRQAAVETDAPVGTSERSLGTTIATLGDPTTPGFWLETPLVSDTTNGRLVYAGTGKEVLVQLIPIDGPSTAGSRISLAAIRLLEAPLAGLPEIQVFAR